MMMMLKKKKTATKNLAMLVQGITLVLTVLIVAAHAAETAASMVSSCKSAHIVTMDAYSVTKCVVVEEREEVVVEDNGDHDDV